MTPEHRDLFFSSSGGGYDRETAPNWILKEYDMDTYTAVALAEGFQEGDDDEVLEAWQVLVNTGVAWQLQGWFGRTASSLIEQGLIEGPNEVAA